MLRKVAATVLLFCTLALSSCQPPMEMFLINNTGAPLRVLYAATQWTDHQGTLNTSAWRRRWYSWPFIIAPGVGRRVNYGPAYTWLLDVRVRGCTLTYVAPTTNLYEDEQWRQVDVYRHTTFQIEPDGRLYLVATPTWTASGKPPAVDVELFRDMQPTGFPAEPTSRRCWWN